jgi:phosphatidylglycerophosphate synthase
MDPLAYRVLPALVPLAWVTPDRLSYVSLALAAGSGAAFLCHVYWLAALLFEVHFFVDCLDGKLARLRRSQNPRGGYLDLVCDLIASAWCLATAAWATAGGALPARLVLLPALGHAVYTWSTLHRSRAGAMTVRKQDRGGPLGWLATHRMVPTPYGVEVETLALFLLPLTGRAGWIRVGLWVAVGFYAVATARNLRATYRFLGRNSIQ